MTSVWSISFIYLCWLPVVSSLLVIITFRKAVLNTIKCLRIFRNDLDAAVILMLAGNSKQLELNKGKGCESAFELMCFSSASHPTVSDPSLLK